MNLKPHDFVPPFFFRIARKMRDIGIPGPSVPPLCYLPPSLAPRRVVDVGANVGDYSVAICRAFPGASSIAIEPVRSVYEALVDRIQAVDLGQRVIPIHAALGAHCGRASINVTNKEAASSLRAMSADYLKNNPDITVCRSEEVPLRTLESVLETVQWDRIDLLKIDAEGMEQEILKSSLSVLKASVECVALEIAFQRDGACEDQAVYGIIDVMRQAEFDLYNIYDLSHGERNNRSAIAQFDAIFRKRRAQ